MNDALPASRTWHMKLSAGTRRWPFFRFSGLPGTRHENMYRFLEQLFATVAARAVPCGRVFTPLCPSRHRGCPTDGRGKAVRLGTKPVRSMCTFRLKRPDAAFPAQKIPGNIKAPDFTPGAYTQPKCSEAEVSATWACHCHSRYSGQLCQFHQVR